MSDTTTDPAPAEPAQHEHDDPTAPEPHHEEPPAALEIRTGAVGSALPDLAVIPPETEMRALAQLANTLAQADAVPKALRRKPNDVFLVLLTARDTGVALTTAMREFHVIEGTVTLSPKVKLAMVRQSGQGRIWPAGDNTAMSATWHATRTDQPDHTVTSTFTWEDAQLAGLADSRCTPKAHWKGTNQSCLCKDNWKRYPQRMVSWRAAGYLLDDVFPEVATGLYSPDELGAITDQDGNAIDVVGVEALPGMRGGRQPAAPAEDQADEEVKNELIRRIESLTYEHREDFKAWWASEIGVRVANLPARLVAKAKARLAFVEAQPGAVEQAPAAESPQDAEEGQTADGEGDAPEEAQAAEEPAQGRQLNEAESELLGGIMGAADDVRHVVEGTEPAAAGPDDLVGIVIGMASAMSGAQIKADFRANGMQPPRGNDPLLRTVWSEWTVARAMTAVLGWISLALVGANLADEDEVAEFIAAARA